MQSRCTVCAVGFHVLDDAVDFPFANAIPFGQYRHDIGHLIASSAHLHVVAIKLQISAIVGLEAQRNEPF